MTENYLIIKIGRDFYRPSAILLDANYCEINYERKSYIVYDHKLLYTLIAYFCGGYPCKLKWASSYRQAYKVSGKMIYHFLWLTRILYPKKVDELYTINAHTLEDIPF